MRLTFMDLLMAALRASITISGMSYNLPMSVDNEDKIFLMQSFEEGFWMIIFYRKNYKMAFPKEKNIWGVQNYV
jgi:hypothetical protein